MVRGASRLVQLGVAAQLLGCGPSTFVCADDGECGAEGRCEASGWCSFPDQACISGRRYGRYSGAGVAGACVDEEIDPATAGPSTTSADTSAGEVSSDVTGASADATTTVAVGSTFTGSTSCGPQGCGRTSSTTALPENTGEGEVSSSTGPQGPPCEGWSDDFEDGVFDPAWVLSGETGASGHTMEEVDGQLRWSLLADHVGLRGLYQPIAQPVGGFVVEVGELPQTSEAQLVILVRDETAAVPDLFFVWTGNTMQFRSNSTLIASIEDQPWLDVRLVAGTAIVSTSVDGVVFDELITQDVETGTDGLSIRVYGQTWTEAPIPTMGSFESISICEP